MFHVHHVGFVGPLAAYARGFAGELARLGYPFESAQQQLRLVAHLSRWMAAEELDAVALTPPAVQAFLTARRAAGYSVYWTPEALAPLVQYLHSLGVIAGTASTGELTPGEQLLERYRRYLLEQRDLAEESAGVYLAVLRPFVNRLEEDGELHLASLTAGEVTDFLLAVAGEQRPGKAASTASALRSLLRFLYLDGVLPRSLEQAVPTVASWKLKPLPRGLEPDQFQRLLAGCDRTTVAGRRDAAILLLLGRLGMRAGEVAGLTLEDFDWRVGEIVVPGKGGRQDRLPLPDDVGQAVADYLRHARPSTAQGRSVFIRLNAPHRGITSEAVSMAVATASNRAGMGPVRAHQLRHTAATNTLAAGGGLGEIGQLLRHRKLLTTAIYAKVDQAALRTLARPWPTGGAR